MTKNVIIDIIKLRSWNNGEQNIRNIIRYAERNERCEIRNKRYEVRNERQNKMTDGFETLELLTENNTNELNKVKIKVSKLEKRVLEFNPVN